MVGEVGVAVRGLDAPATKLSRLVLVAEVAENCLVSESTVKRWGRKGLIKLKPMGRKLVCERSEMERVMREGISGDNLDGE